MPSILKSVSAAVATLALGSAHATLTNVPAGQSLYWVDPDGSGRVADLGPISGSGLLTFSNPGAEPSASNAFYVAGTVGALNTFVASVSSSGGMVVQEQWKSYASSGPDFEDVYFGSRAEADADPRNAPYIASGVLSPNNLESFRLSSAVGGPIGNFSIKTDVSGDTQATEGAPVGSIMAAQLPGQFSIDGPQNAAQTGGRLDVQNLVVDLYNGTVRADVSGTRYAYLHGKYAAIDFSPQNITLWTFKGVAAGGADIAGPTGFNPADWLATNNADRLVNPAYCGNRCFSLLQNIDAFGNVLYAFQGQTTLSNLTMTDAGEQLISEVLHTTQTGTLALEGVNSYSGAWGSLTLNFTIGQVPEPGTYALMGLGLVGISLVARQRKLPA